LENSSEDLHFFSYTSPICELAGVVSEKGLVSISVDRGSGDDIRDREPANDVLAGYVNEVVKQLDSFFNKDLDIFTIDLDNTSLSVFQSEVYHVLRTVPFGRLITYGELARIAGMRGGARAVGGAMGRNPYLLVVPCHRVVASGNHGKMGLGGFSAGLDIKRELLSFEGTISDIM